MAMFHLRNLDDIRLLRLLLLPGVNNTIKMKENLVKSNNNTICFIFQTPYDLKIIQFLVCLLISSKRILEVISLFFMFLNCLIDNVSL